jgi:DNA invertase Pin-like site-specific DNA recombinase
MTEQSQKPKAYSYTRFSTPEQAKGDSHRRQADAAKDWCDRNKVQLDQDLTFLDAGVSAFRGRNVEIGKLGEFRAAVDAGLVPQGSFLLVESLDRISRQAAHRAVRTLMDIIDLGVTVVTLTDGKSYDLETLEKDQMSFLMAILIFMRSAEESQMKSSRLKSTWSQRRATTKGGKVLTRGTKSWIKVNDKGELKVRPEIAKSICYIFETYLTGKGVTHIATRLNERGAPTGTRARAWDAARVYRVLSDRAVLGTLSLNTTEHVGGRKIMHPAEQVEGYYPPVIDKETFDRAQIIKAQAKQTRTSGRKMVNIFSGVMKC